MRNTKRKMAMLEVFSEVFGGRPTLLEEFRWRVLLQEGLASGKNTAICLIDNSIRNSFSETLHSETSTLHVYETEHPVDELPIGLLALSAVWRQPAITTILQFLAGARQVTFSVGGAVIDENGVEKKIRLVIAELADRANMPEPPKSKCPATRGLFFVGKEKPNHWDYIRLAGVPWALRREKDGDLWEVKDAEINFEET